MEGGSHVSRFSLPQDKLPGACAYRFADRCGGPSKGGTTDWRSANREDESSKLAGVGLEADVMQQMATLLRPSRTARWRSSRVEHLICNQAVVGSIPIASFTSTTTHARRASGEVPEWPKGADCKSAGVSLRRFESSPLHRDALAGIAQLARASAFQAEGRGFESRFPLWGRLPTSAHLLRRALHLRTSRQPAGVSVSEEMVARRARRGLHPFKYGTVRACRGCAQVAQSAEHVLGKDEVGGSIPLLGSRHLM
jgi:hypothetical protein